MVDENKRKWLSRKSIDSLTIAAFRSDAAQTSAHGCLSGTGCPHESKRLQERSLLSQHRAYCTVQNSISLL